MVKEGDDSFRPTAGLTAAVAVVVALAFGSFPAFAQTDDAPLSLEDCKALAASRNVEVERADAGLRSAEQMRSAARIAYVPQVSAFGGAMSASSPIVSLGIPGAPGLTVDAAKDGYLTALTAVQPVYAGGRIVNSNRLADVGVRAAEHQRTMTSRDARLEAEAKYWQVVALAEKDRTLRAYQETLAALEAEARDAVASGLSTRNDLLEVSLERGKAAVQRLELESARRLAARDLRRFLGLEDGDQIALADVAPPEPIRPTAEREGEGAAKDRRVEIKLLQDAVESERLQAKLKRGEGLPTVSVGGTAFRYDLSGPGTHDQAILFATVGVPITGAWKGKRESAAALERKRAAELRLADARRLVAEEASKAWDDLDSAWNASQVADLGVEQADVNLAEMRDGYDSGLETLSDLLEAQTLVHQASDRRIDARIAVVLKRSAYLRAIGAE